MAVERKSVLLRLSPELLAEIDAARGAMKRTPWIVEAIERALYSREAVDVDAIGTQDEHGEPFTIEQSDPYVPPGLFKATIRNSDGSDMGLRATEREDGVLEISHVSDSLPDWSPASPPDQGIGFPGPRHSEVEGSENASHSSSTSASEQGPLRPDTTPNQGESSKGSDSAGPIYPAPDSPTSSWDIP